MFSKFVVLRVDRQRFTADVVCSFFPQIRSGCLLGARGNRGAATSATSMPPRSSPQHPSFGLSVPPSPCCDLVGLSFAADAEN